MFQKPRHVFCIIWHFLCKAIFLRYVPNYIKSYTRYWLRQIFCLKENIVKSQIPEVKAKHVNKAIPVTDWLSTWLTENALKINKLGIKHVLFDYKSSYYDRNFEWYQANKNKQKNVSAWMYEWLKYTRVHRVAFLLEMFAGTPTHISNFQIR